MTGVGLVALTLADVGGIAFGIFKRGGADIATGIVIAPQLPLEEPVFLVLLILCVMICYTGTMRLLARKDQGAGLMRYAALATTLVVLAAVVAVLGARRIDSKEKRRRHWAAVGVTLGVVAVLTAVFDNVMIRAGLFWYDPSTISGLFVGVAPIEDFSYAIAACLALPGLWLLLQPRRPRGDDG